jgi:Acetyl esterase (deacetylase)
MNMLKTLLLLLLVWGGNLRISAENYPYRSDVLWTTIPNHADWLYQMGETAKVEVTFLKYGVPRDAEVSYEIGPELMPATRQGTLRLKDGRGTIVMGTLREPGFLDCRLTAKVDGWPHFSKMNHQLTPEKVQTMQYLDVCNFARRVRCPVYMTWGFNDDVCPPTTSYTVWNLLKCPKESLITPINEHWTSDDTEYQQMRYAKTHLK